MGKHSRTPRLRVRSALAAGLVGLGSVGSVGTASAQGPALVEGTPCTDVARACVDLASQQAWLIDGGTVARGPVPISSGTEGEETPRGDFHVMWKDQDHYSAEFDDAPMPFSVFFAEGGIAFHEGNVETTSAGCVRLTEEDAIAFFDYLAVNDAVQVR